MRSKTLISTILILTLSVFTLWAGGEKEAEQAGEATKEYHLMKIASTGGTVSLRGDALRMFEKTLEERTQGAINVELYLDKQLGGDEDNTMQCETGAIQAFLNGSWPHFSNFKGMGMEYYPFAFTDWNHLLRFYETDYVKGLNERLIEEHNLRSLVVCVRGGARGTSPPTRRSRRWRT